MLNQTKLSVTDYIIAIVFYCTLLYVVIHVVRHIVII